VRTGRRTAFGGIAERLRMRPPDTAFERGVRRFGYLLSEAMLVLVLLIFGVNTYFHKPVPIRCSFSIAHGGGPDAAVAAGHHQRQPVPRRPDHGQGGRHRGAPGIHREPGQHGRALHRQDRHLTEGTCNWPRPSIPRGRLRGCHLAVLPHARLQTGLANPLGCGHLRPRGLDVAAVSKIDEIPYDFVRKSLSVIVRQGADGPSP
jgi:Mg2+-importing ATPase